MRGKFHCLVTQQIRVVLNLEGCGANFTISYALNLPDLLIFSDAVFPALRTFFAFGLLSFLDGHDFTGLVVGLPSTAPDTVYRSSRFEGSSALWIIFLFCMIAITPSRRSRQYSSKPPDAHIITVSDWSTQSWEAAFAGNLPGYDGDFWYRVLPIGVMLIRIARADTAFC